MLTYRMVGNFHGSNFHGLESSDNFVVYIFVVYLLKLLSYIAKIHG